MIKIKKYIPKFFAILMLIGGVFDLFHPQQLKAAMDSINMPYYMFTILGVGKIIGSLIILFSKNPKLTEWAFAGFFVWASGGIATHVFSNHGFMELENILVLAILLLVSYWAYTSHSEGSNQELK